MTLRFFQRPPVGLSCDVVPATLPTRAQARNSRMMRRAGLGIVVATLVLSLAACRLAPIAAQPRSAASEASPSRLTTPRPTASTLSTTPVGIEAPPECGFPPGTALEFAGRSTTSALDVHEVVGDPMSGDPADIYITREKFDQGELRGRLVCAVFVDHAGFVEITVHPEDGGRYEPQPSPSFGPPPTDGISEEAAVQAALAHVEDSGTWEMVVVEAGPIGQVLPHVLDDDHYEWALDLLPDLWIWRIHLVRGDEGVDVVVDYLSGSVLGTAGYIVN